MRDDFAAFILTHGRPDKVHTHAILRRCGYTGRIVVVIDNEDKTADGYRKRFGDEVVMFDKAAMASRIDEGDNFGDRRAILYARNACFDIARELGVRYFIQLDDDYTHFNVRFRQNGEPCNGMIRRRMDEMLDALVEFYIGTQALTVAMSQGGDFIGGASPDKRTLKRKAMNTFICSVDRPFAFRGRMNEDVNTYTNEGSKGGLFLTVMQAFVNQETTQKSGGGMTDMYLDTGTYVKSFYSVMYSPSCVKVGVLGDMRSPKFRIHHRVSWGNAVPVILPQTFRKAA